MPEIKARERANRIKALDKSAVIRQRMKAMFIHAKKQSASKGHTEDASPISYAEGQAESIANEGGQLGAYSAKLAFRRGRQVFQQQRIKKIEADRRRRNAPESPDSKTSPDFSVEPGRELMWQQAVTREKPPARPDQSSGGSIQQKRTVASRNTAVSRSAIKTLQNTARVTIKTSQAAEARRQLALQNSARAAQIKARSTRATAKSAAASAKSAAKSAATAAKSIPSAIKASLLALLSGGWVVVLMAVVVVLFGGILALFGDSAESNAYTPVSAEVDAYTPLIQLYAEKHGIPDYVDLIKAVMMAESGGKGSDPMQSSESGFNTKYPRKPKSITDPAYSIDIGVQTLSASIKAAKVENPLDLERIKLALQGYNFGNGYISWALEKHGGYSEANAIEFSQMMAKRLGWSRYGSTKYVSVVLQYYPFGYKFPTGDGDYIWPLPGYTRISSPFGYRNCPYHGRELHGGVDLPAPYGTNILAAKSGTVVLSTYGSSFGNYVAISHADGSRTMYCHMSARLVSVGDTVVQGQAIGRVGSTGDSTGNHLHFELWTTYSSSSRVNPMDYF